jgi:hypothetical protein
MRAALLVCLALFVSGPIDAVSGEEGAAGFGEGTCIGDCNTDQEVTIDEIIRSVSIALGELPESACAAGGPGTSINGLTVAVLNTLDGCFALRDFSGFEAFTFALEPGLGFCPMIGDVYSASLRATAGGYLLSRTVVERGTRGVDACLDQYVGEVDCAVTREETPRTLSAPELERVREGFSAVRVWTAPDPFCIHAVVDPCVITTATWDQTATSDYLHGYSRLDDATTAQIMDVLKSLDGAPGVPAP